MLTKQEFELIQDETIIQLKSASLLKIKLLLQGLEKALLEINLESYWQMQFGEQPRTAKISRGENYLGLPYLILDYPAAFSTTSTAAFRSLFWWGNFFSFTLHLQGDALEKVRNKLIQHTDKIQSSNFYICVNESPWQYHYNSSNYLLCKELNQLELEKKLNSCDFLKLSTKISLAEHEVLAKTGLETLAKLQSLFA